MFNTKKMIIVFKILVLLTVLITTGSAFSDDGLSDGLQAYWKFDEGSGKTTQDISPNDIDSLDWTNVEWTSGKFGNALMLGGTNSCVNFGASNLNLSSELTVSFWLYIEENNSSAYYETILSKGEHVYPFMFQIEGNNYIRAVTRHKIGENPLQPDYIKSKDPISSKTWHHIALTYKPGSKILYIDGNVSDSNTLCTTNLFLGFPSRSNNIMIGSLTGASIKGKVDEVRIYNRSLSSDEIQALTAANPSAAPVILSVQAMSPSGITLAWSDNSSDETGFRIERSIDGISFTQIAEVGANTVTYSDTDSSLLACTIYYYRVRSYNDYGNSTYSNIFFAKTQQIPAAVDITKGLQAYWKFDEGSGESTQDSCPNGIDSLAWTNVEWISDNFGNRALMLGTTNSWVNFGDSNLNLSSELTISFWVYVESNSGSDYETILTRSDYIYPFTIQIAGDNSIRIRTRHNQGEIVNNLDSTNQISPNAWHHVALTYKPGSKILYIDGNVSNSTTLCTTDLFLGFPSQVNNILVGSQSLPRRSRKVGVDEVRIYNRALSSDEIYELSAPVQNNLPATPGIIAAKAVSESEIKLSWVDNSSNETGFIIERGIDGISFMQIAEVGANTVTYSDTSLRTETTNYYRVRAYNTYGSSKYSNISPPVILCALKEIPSNVSARKIAKNSIKLSWTAQDPTVISGYRIYRNSQLIGQVSTTDYTDLNLPKGKYTYQVSAVCKVGLHESSLTIPTTTIIVTNAPCQVNEVYVGSWEADHEFAALTQADLELIKTKKIIIGSRSYGQNIRKGLERIFADKGVIFNYAQRSPAFGEIIEDNIFANYFYLSYMCDLYPLTARITEFNSFFNGSPYTSGQKNIYSYDFSDDVDIAMLEVVSGNYDSTNPEGYYQMYELYKNTMLNLKKQYPHITFIFFTNHMNFNVPDNPLTRASREYNQLLFNDMFGENNLQVPLFDFADILSTKADGEICTYEKNGKIYRKIWPEYNRDDVEELPEHPNTEAIERRLGQGMAVLLQKVIELKTASETTAPENSN